MGHACRFVRENGIWSDFPVKKGTYILILRLKRRCRIEVGRLGMTDFPTGRYAYVGSAFGPGGLNARIRHHLRITPRPRWHLDYLRHEADPVEVWVLSADCRREHAWSGVLHQLDPSVHPVKGFGCSDCLCPAHLFHFRKVPSFQRFQKLLDRRFADDPLPRRFPLTGAPASASYPSCPILGA